MKLPDFKNLRQKFDNLPVVKNILEWTKTHSLPGFFGVPVHDVLKFTMAELQRDSLTTRSNSVAFSLFLSIFPAILFIFTITPFVLPYFDFLIIPNLSPEQVIINPDTGDVDFNKTIIKVINDTIISVNILPLSVQARLIEFMQSLATKQQPGRVIFVLVLAIFFSSNGVLTLMKGFEKSYKSTFIHRAPWLKRVIAIELTFLIFFLTLSSVLLIVLGDRLLNWLSSMIYIDSSGTFGLQVLRWFVVLALFYFVISLIYRIGVPTKKRWKIFSTGATVATILSILATVVFSVYVNQFSTYNQLYGPIGTIIVIMLWIQLNSAALLIGFELNASIAVNRDLIMMSKEED